MQQAGYITYNAQCNWYELWFTELGKKITIPAEIIDSMVKSGSGIIFDAFVQRPGTRTVDADSDNDDTGSKAITQ